MPSISFGNNWLILEVSVSDGLHMRHNILIPDSLYFVQQTPSTAVMTTSVPRPNWYLFIKSGN